MQNAVRAAGASLGRGARRWRWSGFGNLRFEVGPDRRTDRLRRYCL